MKSLIIYYSYHHMNTEKLARKMAETLKADLKEVSECDPNDISDYDLIGIGSGIYHGRHHKKIVGLAERFPDCKDKRAFIFSSSGVIQKDHHSELRRVLEGKDIEVIDDFHCLGFDTALDSEGINRWRPDEEDLRQAQRFAKSLLDK